MLPSLGAPIFVDEALDDTELRFDLRRLDIDGSTLIEPGMVSLVDVDVLRRSVCGENYLLSLAGELVEYLKDDIEGLLLALEVLDVVDEQDIGFLVVGLEVFVARLLLVMSCARLHVVREELGRVDVDRLEVWLSFANVILDGSHEVSFPQTAFPVDKKRVERRFAGHFRNVDGHGVSHAVRVADDEILECERRRGMIARSCGRCALRALDGRLRFRRAPVDVVVEGRIAHAVGMFEPRVSLRAAFGSARLVHLACVGR